MHGLKLTDAERQAICDYYVETGCSISEASRQFGVDSKTASGILKKAGIPMNATNFKFKQDLDDEPSLVEIQRRAAQIRAEWTPAEEYHRRVTKIFTSHYDQGAYRFPVYGSYCGARGARIFREVG